MEAAPTHTKEEEEKRKNYENVWSRLIPALGDGGQETLKKLQTSSVLVIGMKGLGIEIAKNLVLMGIQSLSIFDDEPVQIADLSANFFLEERDIGTKRADACLKKLTELNERVRLDILPALTEQNLLNYKVVVVTNARSREELLNISDICHAHKIGFVAADILGLFGYVFVDLGDQWSVVDKNGEPPKRGFIESITQDETGLVTLWDEKLHDLQDGDVVKFSGVEGMSELNDQEFKVTVKSPFQFAIGDTSKFGVCIKGGTFLEIKKPTVLEYKSLRAMFAEKPKVYSAKDTAVTVDWSKALSVGQYHLALQALLAFREKHGGQLPAPSNKDEAKEVFELAKEINAKQEEAERVEEVDEKLISSIAEVSKGEISPMAALFGGLVGQEVIKASTGKFTPIYQWFFFDALDVLPEQQPEASEFELKGTRYDGQVAIFGNSFQAMVKKLNYFLVGAGAIGCEMLKNWAMMGIGCSEEGQIHLTDIDTIEISNLNRQFLFRESDLSQPKSQVAASAVTLMNPEVNIKPWMVKVAPETEDVFNEKFWKGIDGVTTALDNVEARKYLDSRCVFYGKPMIDSGTQGTKGHVQVVIPHLTESYSASADPPQQVTPVCLLHQFPHTIEHCMQWAREVLFEGYFVKDAEIVNNWLENEHFIKSLKPVVQLNALRTLESCVITRPHTLEDCVLWARHVFEKWYNHAIRRLLEMYPLDHKDDNGSLFWVGGKLPPAITEFDPADEMHVTFLAASAYMRAYTFGLIEEEFRPADFEDQLSKMIDLIKNKYQPEPYQAYANKAMNKATEKKKEDELQGSLDDSKPPEEMDKEKDSILARLPDRAALGTWRMKPVKFEKDDDRNFHVDFIWAAANIRASEYKIKTVERLESKLIAGKIIPAIVTTTSLVTGLVCLELYKVMQKKPFASYKNAFINLAICLLQAAEPIAPSKKKFAEKEWTEWDFIDVKRGDITLGTFLKFMKARHNIEVNSVIYGPFTLYLDFMSKQKIAERLVKPLSELVAEVAGRPLPPTQSVFKVIVAAEDEKGEEMKFIPAVRIWFKTKPKKKQTETKRRKKGEEEDL